MNKKIKLLTPVLCGAILSSSLALTSVQAKVVKNNSNSNISVNSIITNQKYTYCGKISYDAIEDLEDYFQSNPSNPSIMDIRNILIQNGINRSLANNISYSIYDLQMETKKTGGFTIALGIIQYGAEILQAQDGTYTLMTIDGENEPIENYSFYGILEPKDIALVRDFVKSGNCTSVQILAKYMIEKNIVSDPTVADKFSWNLFNFTPFALDDLVNLNQNLLVLKSDDNNYYRIALQSK
ncbi:hypothetical protein [Clostridium drakei]|uniref:Uncharacterized protein n=1 Tax=Clostridium drakei TaxID=332101 RepID=A0A2U8DPP4_9CLOT|nr:hypothetical protein [Clostridium drakei]AWI04072.1 hypothetical protein B9W14_06040 [Clostridium drakei]